MELVNIIGKIMKEIKQENELGSAFKKDINGINN